MQLLEAWASGASSEFKGDVLHLVQQCIGCPSQVVPVG
jgi:hypothetical protein